MSPFRITVGRFDLAEQTKAVGTLEHADVDGYVSYTTPAGTVVFGYSGDRDKAIEHLATRYLADEESLVARVFKECVALREQMKILERRIGFASELFAGQRDEVIQRVEFVRATISSAEDLSSAYGSSEVEALAPVVQDLEALEAVAEQFTDPAVHRPTAAYDASVDFDEFDCDEDPK